MDLIYRFDPYAPIQVDSTPDVPAAIKVLCDGNLRLTSLVSKLQKRVAGDETEAQIVVPVCPVNLGFPLWKGAVAKQAPFALVLGCSDARVPVEAIFDQSFNDLFVVRVAGNVLGTECLGSIDFAVRNFAESLKVVVVLGHTSCGAVAAAVETYLDPRDYADVALSHSLRSLVNRILICVRGAATALRDICGRNVTQHPNYKEALKEIAVFLNVAITAFEVQREIASFASPELRVLYGVYDLATLFVTSMPNRFPSEPSLAPAPNQDGLSELALSLARHVVATGILGDRKDIWDKLREANVVWKS